MKIVIISTYPPKGKKHVKTSGVASYTKNLVTNFPLNREDELYILCDQIDGKTERYNEDNLQVIRCFERNPSYVVQLLRTIKDINPDIIHIQQELALFGNILTAYLLQWLLFVLRKRNVIITLHGVINLNEVNSEFVRGNNSSLPAWLVRYALEIIYRPLTKFAKFTIVHEDAFKNLLVEQYGAEANKVGVIHHGVEQFVAVPRKQACEKLQLDSTKDIVLFMGYLTGYKGIDLLIEGFAEYVRKNKNAYLIIGAGKHPKLATDGKYLKEYNRLFEKAEMLLPQTQYRWIGFINEDDITTYYSAADVSVYPYTNSISSSGPMAIAIGHRKPFLASDAFSGAFPESPVLFERSPQALCKKLCRVFVNNQDILAYVQQQADKRHWASCGMATRTLYLSQLNSK